MPAKTVARLVLIHAETPMHPGAGSALGMVDLPVARERHTQFPYIPGSSLKGVMREACRPTGANGSRSKWLTVFGPETEEAHAYSGALSITDARLLALPQRSLSGLFAWVTCPAVLLRLVRDLRLAGAPDALLSPAEKLLRAATSLKEQDAALTAPRSPLLVGGSHIVLEEFDFKASTDKAVEELGKALADALKGGESLRLATHLVVINDDAFGFASRHGTEVTARIGIDSETKTVKDGALFYEEFLPAGTILYALALADAPRSEGEKKGGLVDPKDVLNVLSDGLKDRDNVLQIGANATTGKGICTVVLAGGDQ